MARRKPPKSTEKIPRTITTRAQAKQRANDSWSAPQVSFTSNVVNQKGVKKKRKKRHSRGFWQRLLKEQQMMKKGPKEHQQSESNNVTENGDSEGLDAGNTGNAGVVLESEMNPVRQEFHDERRVSLSQSPTGKSIQITCRNMSEISNTRFPDMGAGDMFGKNDSELLGNCSEASTIHSEAIIPNLTATIYSEPSTSFHHNLSLGSFNNLQLNKTKEFQEEKQDGLLMQDKNNCQEKEDNELLKQDDDVICLDSTFDIIVPQLQITENIDDDVLFISNSFNDTLPSIIIIDDEPLHNKHTKSKYVEPQDTIDLTTPQRSPAKRVKNKSPQMLNFIKVSSSAQTSSSAETSNPIQPSSSSCQVSENTYSMPSTDVPPRTNMQYPPINELHCPPFPPSRPNYTCIPTSTSHGENAVTSVTPFVQSEDPSRFNYNLQSNIYGNNFLNVGKIKITGLRPIFIDGSNVALLHSTGRHFSVKGIQICIDYFKLRGHEVTAILPQIRKKQGQNSDSKLLFKLEKEGTVVFTPSRVVSGRLVIPYDDRFIVQLAAVHQGVVVSNDNYKDLLAENPNLRDTIENRVLNFTFVKDMLMFPSDPLGRHGPKLDHFLRFP